MTARPRIVGVLNLTPDSFSDGGDFVDPAAALAHAKRLAAGGADVIELGPAASNPDAPLVVPAEEIRRLERVWAAVQALGIPLGVDSAEPATQRWAITHGAAWLNDIAGFADPAMHGALARATCGLVVMHAVQRGPATRVRSDATTIVAEVIAFLTARTATLAEAGIAPERLVVDPGMGFFLGDTPDVSLAVLRALPEIRARVGAPLLVSVSRKSFLGAITGRDIHERGPASLAAELFCAVHGVAWIRTHDPAALRDALAVRAALDGNGG